MASRRLLQTICVNLILIVGLTITFFPAQARGIPTSDSNFAHFVNSVKDGQVGILRGVYAEGILSLLVVQQPSNNPAYVATVNGVVTEFQAAKLEGNIGLLAHNFLAGKNFPALAQGKEVRAVFGDGKIEYYRITKILRFKTLDPRSTTSNFINLDDGKLYSATQVFALVYKGSRHVTLQTCINKNGDASWGRLFIIAEPLTQQ